MKHKNNNKHTNYDVEFMQATIDGLFERNQELETEVERLKTEMAETNDVNIQLDVDEQKYKNLVQLHTLLMVLMNLIIVQCDNSPLGQAVGKAIKRYQIVMAKSLAKGTLFINEDNRDDWEEGDDEDEFGEEEF